MTPHRLPATLAAAAWVLTSLLLTACGPSTPAPPAAPAAAPDRYDISKMDLKSAPAKVSAERHTGAFAEGASLSMGALLKPLDPAPVHRCGWSSRI